MVEAILIGVIVISIFGFWKKLNAPGSWNPHEINRRITQRRLKNKEERIERRKRRKARSETNNQKSQTPVIF